MYLVGGILDVVCTAGRNVRVQRLVLCGQRSTVFVSHLTFLHRSLPTNDYRRARLTNKQTTLSQTLPPVLPPGKLLQAYEK